MTYKVGVKLKCLPYTLTMKIHREGDVEWGNAFEVVSGEVRYMEMGGRA